MKSIYLTDEHHLFRQTVRKFMVTEVAPFADEWEKNQRIPKSIWKKMGDIGFLGLPFSSELGGAGVDIFYSMIFLEECARSSIGGFCAAVSVHEFISTQTISKLGTSEMKEKYLQPSISGEKVGAIAISEPNTGSDVASIQTHAILENGTWVINGSKTWITNAVYGDFFVLACKTDRAAGAKGISLIVIDADTPGVQVRKLSKLGCHSSDTAEISLENVRVPEKQLLGKVGSGFAYILQTFVIERLVAAATFLGSSIVALEETKSYMQTRQSFGQPIIQFQALRHRLADLYTEIEATRALLYHAAWLYQQGEKGVRESSMAKLKASEVYMKVVDECLQFHGGFGYVEEYKISRYYRDARVSAIVAGTSEIMREIIARSELG